MTHKSHIQNGWLMIVSPTIKPLSSPNMTTNSQKTIPNLRKQKDEWEGGPR